MLTTNYLFILTKSVNYSVTLCSNQNMNSDGTKWWHSGWHYYYWTIIYDDFNKFIQLFVVATSLILVKTSLVATVNEVEKQVVRAVIK